MTDKIIIALALALSLVGMAIFPNSSDTNRVDLNGTWSIALDFQIDGRYNTNPDCTSMQIEMTGPNTFTARYLKCQPASQVAMPSKFIGQIYQNSRGILISMIQEGRPTNYYASWAGTLNSEGEIVGLISDLVGNQGEYKLTQQ